MQILSGLILLGVLIAFHELGHFLVAKLLGVRVLVFSLGFGPKLLGFKKGHTEYRLSAIPLGGYVRMFGESLEQELSEQEKKISFMHQPIWRKSLIAFAGPLFNFILPVIVLFSLLIGEEKVLAPKVGTLIEGGAAQEAGMLDGDEILEVDGQKVRSFNEVAETIRDRPGDEIAFKVSRLDDRGRARELSLTMITDVRSSKNPLDGGKSVGQIGIMPAIAIPQVVVVEDSPLKAIGLQSFDVVTHINHKPIKNLSLLMAALRALRPPSIITVERRGEPIELKARRELSYSLNPDAAIVEKAMTAEDMSALLAHISKTKEIIISERRLLAKSFGIMPASGAIVEISHESFASRAGLIIGDRIVSIDGERLWTGLELHQAFVQNSQKPHVLGIMKLQGGAEVITASLPPKAVSDLGLSPDLFGVLGLRLAETFKAGETITREVGGGEALARAFHQTVEIAALTGKSLWMLIKGEAKTDQIGGPIMLFDVAQQAAQKGLSYYLFIMCLISINLGLLNLLPIPALDGGHLMLFGVEAIIGRPLSARVRGIVTQIGIAILLLIMALAIFNDLARIFR